MTIQRTKTGLRWSLECVLVFIVGALAVGAVACEVGADAPLSSVPYEFEEGEVTLGEALDRVQTQIEAARERAESNPTTWRPLAERAGYELRKARLVGGQDAYAAAERSLSEAFVLAPEGSGPWLALARLEFTLHRLAQAEVAIETASHAILIDDPTRADIEGLRGDIALQRGQMDDAWSAFVLAETLHPTSDSAARLALWFRRVGDLERADAHYEIASSRYHGVDAYPRAWFELQRGLLDLDRGAYDAALTHYLEANRRLSGFFLVEEHVAEVLALLGKRGQAYGVYLDLVARTGSPEFMDAIAGLYDPEDGDASRRDWIEAAEAAHEEAMEASPESGLGHAIAHFLEYGPAPRALELAVVDHALRPNPAAKRRLALACLRVGAPLTARVWIEEALAGAWRSFELHETAAGVYRVLGDEETEAAQWGRACAFAPLRCDEGGGPP